MIKKLKVDTIGFISKKNVKRKSFTNSNGSLAWNGFIEIAYLYEIGDAKKPFIT